MRRVVSCLMNLGIVLAAALAPAGAEALSPGGPGAHARPSDRAAAPTAVKHGPFVGRHPRGIHSGHHGRSFGRVRHGYPALPLAWSDGYAPTGAGPAYPSEVTIRSIPELPISSGLVTQPAGTPALYVIHADRGFAEPRGALQRPLRKGAFAREPSSQAPLAGSSEPAGERSLVPRIVHVVVPRGY